MIDYGTQRSTVEPLKMELTDSKVFIASNITPVNEPGTDEKSGFAGFEFDLVEYDKDEFIKLQAEQNEMLQTQITDTQVALCEVYELMA
jgi:hypothetical protein